jgi:hypothetical protein
MSLVESMIYIDFKGDDENNNKSMEILFKYFVLHGMNELG